jgi:hypothetical protein
MRIAKVLLALGAVLVSAASAGAATVTSEQGQVLVNRGDGYKLVTDATEAAPGHLVIVNPGGIGRVVYPDGCTVALQPGVVFSIAPKSPCVRSGGHVETGGSLKDEPKPVETEERSLVPALIAGGVAVGVGVFLLHRDKGASP